MGRSLLPGQKKILLLRVSTRSSKLNPLGRLAFPLYKGAWSRMTITLPWTDNLSEPRRRVLMRSARPARSIKIAAGIRRTVSRKWRKLSLCVRWYRYGRAIAKCCGSRKVPPRGLRRVVSSHAPGPSVDNAPEIETC